MLFLSGVQLQQYTHMYLLLVQLCYWGTLRYSCEEFSWQHHVISKALTCSFCLNFDLQRRKNTPEHSFGGGFGALYYSRQDVKSPHHVLFKLPRPHKPAKHGQTEFHWADSFRNLGFSFSFRSLPTPTASTTDAELHEDVLNTPRN